MLNTKSFYSIFSKEPVFIPCYFPRKPFLTEQMVNDFHISILSFGRLPPKKLAEEQQNF